MLNLLKYHKKHVPVYESKPYILFESVILLFLHVEKSVPLNVWNVSYASIIYWTWYNVLLCNSFQLYSVFVAAAKCPIGLTGKYCESQCQFPDYGYGCQQSCLCSKDAILLLDVLLLKVTTLVAVYTWSNLQYKTLRCNR